MRKNAMSTWMSRFWTPTLPLCDTVPSDPPESRPLLPHPLPSRQLQQARQKETRPRTLTSLFDDTSQKQRGTVVTLSNHARITISAECFINDNNVLFLVQRLRSPVMLVLQFLLRVLLIIIIYTFMCYFCKRSADFQGIAAKIKSEEILIIGGLYIACV